MVKNKNAGLSSKLAEIAVHGMQEKKGNEIVRLDLRNINSSVSDYFVICHADSTTQVNAIAKSVEEEIFKAFGQDPWHKEGHGNGEWILIDFVDVVVHIFKTEKRSHYGIEDLWGDADVKTYQSA
ncbi:ribosome silencing factor [Sphingobacterium spiritivorum]|uniref:Ribosomal silencing factor RsfS n=1 Tax=Sphingobacterium spiritivorum ATCC 33861 TaxID=525373 RepID=D7VIB6_SPHSI|nr:ribosome silencing factor [Sphingobacterium spiritivorum]EFK59818.1 iojap-like protein [Sphingobacterium spiritivorum ATCC 33861]QQT37540.1 ribosome silencing factor [Sphingobacterium spiritivorum]WQD34337.1 ribosome silencing factor [Sphingobacterium spiritivorum]SUI97262.1 ribosome-associated protein [Sphingobacterium spiritivorum]